MTFDQLLDKALDSLRGDTTIGIDPDRITFGGAKHEPPSLNVSIYPIQSETRAESRTMLSAAVDIYVHSRGSSSEEKSLRAAMSTAAAVRSCILKNIPAARNGTIQIATVIDDSGRVVFADRTVLLVSFEVGYGI